MAKSASYLHTFNFVHKNIRPESVLCFRSAARTNTFLVGFDAFRAADGSTNLFGDVAWDRNLYRHPQRQGLYVAEKHRMEHDIYSLGVCLLEIRLWESLVMYSNEGAMLQAGVWYEGFQAWLQGRIPRSHDWAWLVKKYLTHVATTVLPIRMGDKYTSAVLACLTCLDEPDVSGLELSEQVMSPGSMQVAVRFCEDTLFLLNEIST